MSEAFRVLNDEGNAVGARALFLQVADEYQGTVYEARALLWASSYQDTAEQCKALLQRIIDHHPGTKFETLAKMNILQEDYVRSETPDEELYVKGLDDLAIELGGPSLHEILTGDTFVKTDALRRLSQEQLNSLLTIHCSIAARISARVTKTVLGHPTGNQPALTVAKYLRQTFEPLLPEYRGMEVMRHYLEILEDYNGKPLQFANPIVTFLPPSSGATTGPTPTIEFETTVGDRTHYQVSLGTMVVSLDENDVTRQIRVSGSYGAVQPGVPFETLKISYTPEAPLAPGKHELNVRVPVEKYSGTGPGLTEKKLVFYL